MPLCGCQRFCVRRRTVERAIAQHGEQDVAATPGERDESLVVTLALADLAGGQLTADGRAGAARDRCEPCIDGQMARRGEGTARNVDQESGCGPDADSRHARQDRAKRVRHYKPFNLLRDFFALPAQSCQLLRQARQAMLAA